MKKKRARRAALHLGLKRKTGPLPTTLCGIDVSTLPEVQVVFEWKLTGAVLRGKAGAPISALNACKACYQAARVAHAPAHAGSRR